MKSRWHDVILISDVSGDGIGRPTSPIFVCPVLYIALPSMRARASRVRRCGAGGDTCTDSTLASPHDPVGCAAPVGTAVPALRK